MRTEENLADFLSGDLAWRKREIATLRWLIDRANPGNREPLLRSAVALLYAHWEGFIKGAGSAYLEFVHYRRLKNSDLAPHFVALAARSILKRGDTSNRFSAHLDVAMFFLSRLHEQSSLPFKNVVDTGSNLSSLVLKEILLTLGLDVVPFETKFNLIDERLVRVRNTIAHGEYLLVDKDSVDELAQEVLKMLEAFKAQIDEAMRTRRYCFNGIN